MVILNFVFHIFGIEKCNFFNNIFFGCQSSVIDELLTLILMRVITNILI